MPEWRDDWPLAQELAALAAGRVCHAARQRQCQAEHGRFARWACGACQEFIRPEAVSPWTWHLVFLHHLRRAGYPFRANDLSVETWLLLGWVSRVLEHSQRGRYAPEQQ
jgi:hypothetical protein